MNFDGDDWRRPRDVRGPAHSARSWRSTWTFGASTLIVVLLATRGQDTNKFRDHLGAGRVVDVPFLAAALQQTGATQHIKMMRARRPGNLQLSLNVSGGHFRSGPHKKEEDL